MGIAKDLKRGLEASEAAKAAVPWWMGLTTIERARAINAEIEGQMASFAKQHKAFENAFVRMGFAGHALDRRRPRT